MRLIYCVVQNECIRACLIDYDCWHVYSDVCVGMWLLDLFG